MAASINSHAEGLEIEIIVGSYEQVLFGYALTITNDAASLSLSFTDKTHCGSVRAVAASSSKLLASGSTDEVIQLFDLQTRHEAGTLMKHSGTITNIEFYDEFMISSDDSGIICIWKILGRSYECMKTLSGHKGSVVNFAIHPSGKLLLSVGHDKTLRTWNLVTAKRAYTTNTTSIVDIIQWSPDGERYILCYNGKIDVCLISNAAPILSVKLSGKGHSLGFLTKDVLAVGCEGGSLAFLNITAGIIVHEYKVDCNRIKCISVKKLEKGKSLIALTTNDGVIELLMVQIKNNSVTTSLIAATKTVLRPICMELVVSTGERPTDENKSSEKIAEDVSEHSTAIGKKKIKKKTLDKSDPSLSDDKPSLEAAEDVSPKPGKKRKLSKQTKTSPAPEMDKIKKMVGGKSKETKSENGEVKHKRHMKPVDSMKITKQKFSNQKKQHARHHDTRITEEEAEST